MKRSKPPKWQRQLRSKIQNILTKLSKPQLHSQTNNIQLYNDFLILKVVTNTIPQDSLETIYRQLTCFETHLNEYIEQQGRGNQGQKLNWDNNIHFRNIMQILVKIETQDSLLKDFLACSGYSKEGLITIS